jgi:splicing factor 3B subunit 4
MYSCREQDKEATIYVGNLDERAHDKLIWELFIQVGRVQNVHLPKDRVTQTHQGYGFVEFMSEEDADYASKVMNGIRLYGKPIRVNKASADKQRTVEVGAELFIGNLDSMVDEKTLYDIFSRFGGLVAMPKVARDDAGLSKGYGFVSFANFDASDDAIANMHGQFISNKEISVQYAYKKDGKGERHGDEAERMLARQAANHGVSLPVNPIPQNLFAQPPITPVVAQPPQLPQGFGVPQHGGPPAGMPPSTPTPPLPSGFGGQPYPPPNHAMPPYMNGAPPSQGPPSRGPPQNAPLPPPPAGLPARPPPSQAGYGGPPNFPGYGAPPPNMPPGFGR